MGEFLRKQSRPNRWLVVLTLIACVVIGSFVWTALQPAPLIPIPGNLGTLEPQLRAYVNSQAAWVREKPKNANRHATLGMVYAANGLWREASRCFENVAALNPREPLAHLYIGVAAMELGDSERAVEQFRVVTREFPAFPQGHYRLGEAWLRAGATDEAAQAYRRLTELAPKEWRGHAGLGAIELRKGNAAEAVKLLEKAVQIEPGAKSAHYQLGLAYRSMGRQADAERELRAGVDAVSYPMADPWSESAPGHMRLLQDQFDMAADYRNLGHPEKAIELLENARRFHPANVSLLNNLAVAYLQSGQPEKSRKLTEQILQSDSNNLSATVTLSASFLALSQPAQALAQAERATIIAPAAPQSHIAKANVLLATERDNDALAALEAALPLDPNNALLRMEMGDVHWRNLSQTNEAAQCYQQAIDADPLFVPPYLRLVSLQLESGATNKAWTTLKAGRKWNPANPELAQAARELGVESDGPK